MLSRVQRLLNLGARPSDDQASISQHCPTSTSSSGASISDTTSDNSISNECIPAHDADDSGLSLCIKESTIIRQNNYPTASGGLGDVYKCTRKSITGFEEVAVKSPRFADLSEVEAAKVNKNINREIKIWGGLKHQYVLPFYGTVEGFSRFRALVSPWMPNGNLSTYLSRTDSDVALTEMDRLILLIKITEGLKYLHDNNVIHGDLTSNNVLIAADGSPRLADFGISNIITPSNTAFSYHTGAVRWVAPEFVIIPEEETVQYGTKYGDTYALGCIILQVLYGKEPYWWLKNALQVIAAKFIGAEPINSSIQIQPIHLDFMNRCWLAESEARPSVDDVLEFINKLCLLHDKGSAAM